MIDIINEYVKAGFSCTLLTGRLVVRNNPLHPSVKIGHIIRYNRVTTFKRLYTWTIAFLQIWSKILVKYRKDTLFIVSNPPFAPLLPLFVKNRFILLFFDIYPDVLSELGYLSRNSRIINWWEGFNSRVFVKAAGIFTITNGMKKVLSKYVDEKKIDVVSLWTDNEFLKPVSPHNNPFIEKHNLSGKFVVLYSGNLGLAGDVDVLLEVAAEITRNDIIFVIIGEGARKVRMQEKARSLNIENVVFLPWQPVNELTYSFSSADLAVVTLGKGASMLAIPSKLYNFLSVGAPLLCISPENSEVDNLISGYDCGRNFESSETKRIIAFIMEVAGNKSLHQQMKANSLKASAEFNSDNVIKLVVN